MEVILIIFLGLFLFSIFISAFSLTTRLQYMDFNNKMPVVKNRDYFMKLGELNKHIAFSMKYFNSNTKLNSNKDEILSNNFSGCDRNAAALNIKALSNGCDIYPTPSLSEYLTLNSSFNKGHKVPLKEIDCLIQSRSSLRQLNTTTHQILTEALHIVYIILLEKRPLCFLKESMERIIGIAAVLVEMKADMSVVIAGVLQEVMPLLPQPSTGTVPVSLTEVETTPATESANGLFEQLIKRLGEDSVHLAVKYSHLPLLMPHHTTTYSSVQAENQLQMLVAVAEDYRSLYIRLAERLYTMRGLRNNHHNYTELPVIQLQIAVQVRHVYALLAHRMNMMKIRNELEDLAFRILEPDMFQLARYSQRTAGKSYQDAVAKIEEFIHNDPILFEQRVRVRLTDRIKSKYQIYLKMKHRKYETPFQVRDNLGLRLILDIPSLRREKYRQYVNRKKSICYYIIHGIQHLSGWEADNTGYKDFIKYPKENGYQSLHQYIRHLSLNVCVEVQVRTFEMHTIAEIGCAAHWWYKDMLYRPEIARSKAYRLAWRSKYQLCATSAAEVMGLAKQQLLTHRVFVLLEDGATVLNLKKGATALDAAFAIHSSIGMNAQAIRVNNHTVSMDTVLCMGDVVSVQQLKANTSTTPTTTPATMHGGFASQNKLTQVRTRYAFKMLRKFFRKHNETYLLASDSSSSYMHWS